MERKNYEDCEIEVILFDAEVWKERTTKTARLK